MSRKEYEYWVSINLKEGISPVLYYGRVLRITLIG